MAAMNRGLNLPSIQRIMNEFEKESAAMDMKEGMMADAVDDVMEDEDEDEEEEGDKILKEVLDEIGVGLQQQLAEAPTSDLSPAVRNERQAVAVGESAVGPGDSNRPGGSNVPANDTTDEDALQARLDALRRP